MNWIYLLFYNNKDSRFCQSVTFLLKWISIESLSPQQKCHLQVSDLEENHMMDAKTKMMLMSTIKRDDDDDKSYERDDHQLFGKLTQL